MKKLILSKSVLLSILFSIGSLQSISAQEATAYKYLRLSIDELQDNDLHLDQVRWTMGNTTLPISDLISHYKGDSSISENTEVKLISSIVNTSQPAYKAFEKGKDILYFGANALPVTLDLEFKEAIPSVTGINLSIVYGTIRKFRCYGSNDGENWSLIYTSPTLSYNDFTGPDRDYIADFELTLPPSVDQPPSTPTNLFVSDTTSIAAEINWDASNDDTGVLLYEIFINDTLWQKSEKTSVTIYNLSPQSSYSVKIRAVDYLGNMSDFSDSGDINTQDSYPLAIRKIGIGTGIGHSNRGTGIFNPFPDFGGNWQSDDPNEGPFSQAFIDDMKKFSYIRFMNVLGISNSAIVEWDDRIQADNPNQVNKYHGGYSIINNDVLSYEWAIYLCNITDTDMWLNVPANANENYVRQLAKLIKNNLNSNLNIYLENGNETWNRGFPILSDYRAKGAALGFGGEYDNTTSYKYMVYKTVRVFKWFNEEFGNKDRVSNVLTGQQGSKYVSTTHLNALKNDTIYPNDIQINPDQIMPDYYGLGSYFNLHGVEGEDGYTRMKKAIDAGEAKSSITLTQMHFDIWHPEKIPLIVYEGGIHMNKPLRNTYSRDIGIYNVYLHYLDQLAPYYYSFTHYSYVFGGNNSNAFGAIDYVGQSLSDAPRLRALFDWMDTNKDNSNESTPIIFQHPQDITVANGITDLTFVVSANSEESYQWIINNENIIGANDVKYTTNEINLSDDGTEFQVEVINSLGSTFSNVATLTVTNHHLDIVETPLIPIIDGVIDEMWESIESQNIVTINKGAILTDTDLAGNFKATWDTENIYLLVQVTDDILVKDISGTDSRKYNYDGLEIYINGDNAHTNSYKEDIQFIYNWDGDIYGYASGFLTPIDGVSAAQTNSANGYVMEIAIPWSLFNVTAEQQKFFGFDIFISDNDIAGSSGVNEKKSWYSFSNESWHDPREFASVKLISGVEVPIISSQPSNVMVSLDSTASFSISATGKGISYQWFKDSIEIPGANSSSFTVNLVNEADAGNYHVVISNTAGSVTSDNVILTVNSGGYRYRYLRLTLNEYTNLNLLEIDWITDNGSVPLSGMTSNNSGGLVVSDDNNSSIIYRVFDKEYTNGAWIGSGDTPYQLTLDLGDNSAMPSGIKIHKYSWAIINGFKVEGSNDENNWDLLLETTESEIVFNASDDGDYLEEAIFNFTSSQGISITTQPSNVTVSLHSTASFSIAATGNALTYQWFKDAIAIPDANSNSFAVNSVNEEDAGSYHVVISNAAGSVTSDNVILTVNSGGYRYLRLTLNEYSNLNLLEVDWITDSGSVPLSGMISNNSGGIVVSDDNNSHIIYRVFDKEYTNGAWIGSGETPYQLTLDLGTNSAMPTGIELHKYSWAMINGFKVEGSNDENNWDLLLETTESEIVFNASDDGDYLEEAIFNFTPSQGISITTQPSNVTVSLDIDSTASFSIVATGNGLTYQWFKDAIAIPDAISSSFTVNSVNKADAGNYHVVISNTTDSVTSDSVILAVNSREYRYLRLTLNEYTNLNLLEVDWITDSGSVPLSGMTSNNSGGIVVSGNINSSITYRAYDKEYTNGSWIGSSDEIPYQLTLDLGDNLAMLTGIEIHKYSWAIINDFKVEGSNDENNWDLLLEKTETNESFSPSNEGENVKEAIFYFE